MNLEIKQQRIRTLRYVVASRWFLHAGLVILGLVQKVIGVAEFNPDVFGLILVTYSYNYIFYRYLHRSASRISHRGLNIVTLLQVIFDQIIYTVVLYTTGGVESLSFLFYFLSIFIAIIICNEWEIIGLTMFTVGLYISVIALEYSGVIPHYYRYQFDPGFYHNIGVTVHNSATVVLILIFTAFFAAFINNIIRSRENNVVAERDKLNAIIDNLVDGIVLLDAEGQVALMNPYAQQLLRLRSNQMVRGQLPATAFSSALQPVVRFINNASKEASYHSQELQIDDDEDHIDLQVTALQVIDARSVRLGSLVILRNITKEKDLDQMKSDFISVAAHQLRTPLATLKWLFKLLIDGDGGSLSGKQVELLKKGFERNEEVIEIVNNLLDVSEIEEGRFGLKMTSVPLTELLEQMVADNQVNAQRNRITLQYQAPAQFPRLKCDRQKIRMAIQNLIDNAIKYSQPNSTVEIILEHDKTNHHVTVAVRDNGIGMSEETQQRLFNKFYRGKEAVMKEPTGSGLGLYIVRSIIERHHGTLTFTSKLGLGTTFTIRLPL